MNLVMTATLVYGASVFTSYNRRTAFYAKFLTLIDF